MKQEVEKIFREYQDFRKTVQHLLRDNSSVADSSTIYRGAMTTAGTTAEIILKYIIEREKLEIVRKDRGDHAGKPPGLNDLIHTLTVKKMLPATVKNHLGTLQSWRNHGAHGNHLDGVEQMTIESINTSMKYIIRWFFEDYLKGVYKEYSLNAAKPEEKKEEAPPLAAATQSGSTLAQPERRSRTYLWLLLLLVAGFGTYYLYSMAFAPQEQKQARINPSSKEEVYQFLLRYYASLNQRDADAHDYFADKISVYYTKTNYTPAQVNAYRKQETDYIDFKNQIDKSTLFLQRREGTINYWRFWNDFSCYRTKRRKFQSCKVLAEFGINDEGKITSIYEISSTKPVFTDRKP